jgi:hypothetical protein
LANEYIFFDAALRDRFTSFVAGLGIACGARPDAIAGFVVDLPDDLADALEAAIEAEYDALMDEQRELVEALEGDEARDLMGVDITLADGRTLTVRLPAQQARRLFEHFSSEEIHALVSAIADSVLDPIDGPICRDR